MNWRKGNKVNGNIDKINETSDKNQDTGLPKKQYLGISFLILLICNFIYMIPHFLYYQMGGLQAMVSFFLLFFIMFIADVLGMFILAAILRKVMPNRLSKLFLKVLATGLIIFLAVNLYRSTLPLPYLQFMIDKIPNAVEHFEKNKDEFQDNVNNGQKIVYFYEDDFPAGPMVNMIFVYVQTSEEYPEQTGQISRTEYIHPLDQQWYLHLFQAGAI